METIDGMKEELRRYKEKEASEKRLGKAANGIGRKRWYREERQMIQRRKDRWQQQKQQ